MPSRSLSDETYVIDLCDEVLGTVALRQHRFDFLRGDAGPGKQGMRLPVDAYYPELQLVVEYCERQHTEAIPIMDRRMTVSGVDRARKEPSTISAGATSFRSTALSWWNYPTPISRMTRTSACAGAG